MKIRKVKKVTESKEVTIAIKCDVCEKIHNGNEIPLDWHSFNSNHNEWGNDSCESSEYYEVCSVECYWTKFKECVEEFSKRNSAEIDGFNVQFARLLILQTKNAPLIWG